MQGQQLGAYLIDAELGSGGMGRVVRATGPDGVVALKVVHPHLLETPGFLDRFQREAEIGLAVRHPNVVRTHAYEEIEGAHVLVMEYVEGQTLGGLQKELERVPEELCRHVAREICKGLGAIHEAGVVHRDLKPENVLITPNHIVKIMDLGVAKLVDAQMQLSQTGAFIGSVEYAAPEQFKGGTTDHRTDLHALGLVLYELATGQHPYRGGSFLDVFRRVCEEEPRPLGQIDPQLSAFFEELVHTLLVKDPRGRFASSAQLLAALESGESSTWWNDRALAIQAKTKRPLRRIRIPRETAVYGRDDELAKLRACYARAAAGEGQVVLIEGEAGIGKSRLVDELVARFQSEGLDVNFLFGGYPPGGAATDDVGFSAAYGAQFGAAGSADYLRENELLVPAFDALLRGEEAPPGAQMLSPRSLQTCFVRATETLAKERVTIVLIDDLHFAPDEGRALFSSLATALPGHRVLLIGTARPGVTESWRAELVRLPHTTQIELQRLGAKDLAQLLGDSFQSEQLAGALGHQIALKSDGNPFFAFEIIRGLREGKLITQRPDGTWATTQIIEEIEIPSSVLDLVSARVSDLSEEERDLLDVAACWGFEFDPGLVGEVLGLGRIPVLKRFGHLERKHRLVRASGRRMVFDHHQVQEALYGSLLEQLREEYHGALAEALETRLVARRTAPDAMDGPTSLDLCEHYLKGLRHQDAVRYLPRAQEHLAAGFLHARLIDLTERALAMPGLVTGVERAQTLLRMAKALDSLGRRERQDAVVQEAKKLVDDVGDESLRGLVAVAEGTVLAKTGRVAEAETHYRRGREIAIACGDRLLEAKTTGHVAVALLLQGRHDEGIAELERHRDLSREIGYLDGEAAAACNLGVAYQQAARIEDSRREQQRVLELGRQLGDRSLEADAFGNLGILLYMEKRFDEALSMSERALALNREIGNRATEASNLAHIAGSLVADGQLVRAAGYYEQSYELAGELQHRQAQAVALVNLGPLRQALGDVTTARRQLDEALALSRDMGARYVEGYAWHGLGYVALEEGDHAGAAQNFEQAIAVRRAIGHRDGLAESLVALADVHWQSGDLDRAKPPLEEGVALAEELGMAAVAGRGLALTALAGGDVGAALEVAGSPDKTVVDLRSSLLLFRATGDTDWLRAARRTLESSLAKLPESHREAVRTNVADNRAVLDAWRAEFGDGEPAPSRDSDGGGDDDDPRGTESVTRVG